MKVVLIDDELLARAIVKEYLQNYPDLEIVAECSDGFEGLKAIQQHKPTLIFLDIQMPKINGFEMLELVDDPPPVIFTTAFDEYAMQAFEKHAIDYLLKPFSKERFDKALQKWLQLHNNNAATGETKLLLQSVSSSELKSNRVIVKDGEKIKIIPLAQIQYLEAADDYVKIYTAEGSFLKNKTMQFFEMQLNSQQYVRIHRSYIVNIALITRIDPSEKDSHLIVLSNGKKLPVSKTGYVRLKEVFGI
ncbi:LytTR family DNA-binding domain-containing protein [soil metagenome]